MTAPDPGPPPAVGLVVRPEGEGFHARIWPRPPKPWGRWAIGLAAGASIGVGLGFAVAERPELRFQIAAAITVFVALLGLVDHVRHYLPAELQVDDDLVYWNGERFPMAAVRGARAEADRLVLLGEHGPCAELVHLRPEVAAWLAAAIQASVPTAGA